MMLSVAQKLVLSLVVIAVPLAPVMAMTPQCCAVGRTADADQACCCSRRAVEKPLASCCAAKQKSCCAQRQSTQKPSAAAADQERLATSGCCCKARGSQPAVLEKRSTESHGLDSLVALCAVGSFVWTSADRPVVSPVMGPPPTAARHSYHALYCRWLI